MQCPEGEESEGSKKTKTKEEQTDLQEMIPKTEQANLIKVSEKSMC